MPKAAPRPPARNRATNTYGKRPEEREPVLRDLAEMEPLLRRTCTVEIDVGQPLTTIVN
jgi:hypothetical protein